MNILKVKYLQDYQLEVTFEDRVMKIADFSSFLKRARNPMTTQFRDIKLFMRVCIKDGDLVWGKDEEMDIDSDDIYNGVFDP